MTDSSPSYREVLGKVEGLQRGFTSGTCALAAAKGAVLLLLEKLKPDLLVEVTLKKGVVLNLPLEDAKRKGDSAVCTIRKDSGDDDDISHGALFQATVNFTGKGGIELIGGKGVGKVTRGGLPIPVGEAAINPGPRSMITENIIPLLPAGRGVKIVISIPEGEALARKTWNPRIGIEGGLSIIGNSGVIEPKSNAAFKASIALLIKSLKANGQEELYLAPGYVGDIYYKNTMGLDEGKIIHFGDHAGFSLRKAASKHFKTVHLACHIGKMAKLAAGLFDTHCRTGDARLETVAALAGAAGADKNTINALLDMKMAEEAVPLLDREGLEETYDLMARRTAWRIRKLWEKEYDHLPELKIYVLDLKGRCLNSPLSISYAAAMKAPNSLTERKN